MLFRAYLDFVKSGTGDKHDSGKTHADRTAIPCCRQPLVVDEARKAARAIAALLDLAAVAVEDPIAEIGAGEFRPFDQQQLVEANAEVTIAKALDQRRVGRKGLVDPVDDHKVIAKAVHFGETQVHVGLKQENDALA